MVSKNKHRYLKSLNSSVTHPNIFFGRSISAGGLEGAMMSPYGSRAKPWWESGGKALGSSKNLVYTLESRTFDWNIPSATSDETNSTYFFPKILPKFDFEVNFSVQSYASLSHEDPAYLQITYYIYYLKYTELKSFFGDWVWLPTPLYRLLNSSGYVIEVELT